MSLLKIYQNRLITNTAILAIMALLVSGCASKKKQDLLTQEERIELLQQKVDEIYQRGKTQLDKGNYTRAVEQFTVLQRVFPFGDITEQSKLDTIFAHDKLGNREQAVRMANSFISLYPTHPNIDYAYYMKGVAMFEKKKGKMSRFLNGKGSKVIRDPQAYRNSQASFEELIKRYPESKYSEDAAQRLVYISNVLAKRELDIAQFYFDNDTYLAAVNRCKTIIYQYETTPSVEGALELMEKAYTKMGLNDLAESTHQMLITNFPDSDSSRLASNKKSLLKRIIPFY